MIYYKIEHTKQGLALVEEAYDRKYLAKTETVFSQCNGYLGVRAAFEMRLWKESRGTFLGGFFHKASEFEVTELVNCPDVTEMEITLDGESLSLDICHILNFSRRLYLESGELETLVQLETEGGRQISMECRRFASRENKHLFVHEVTLEPARDGEVTVMTGINGQISNSGVSHFAKVEARAFNKKYLYTRGFCEDGQMLHVMCTVGTNRAPIRTDFTLKRRSIYEKKSFILNKGEQLKITKCSYFGYEEWDCQAVLEQLKESLKMGYEGLSKLHQEQWVKYWKYANIKIKGADKEVEACLKFATYHMLGMTPADTDAYSVAAKGLTGEGYKGHVFWDTELFVMPFFTSVFPEIAKNLLGYRYKGLDGARKKARDYGYQGAMYPWETARTGAEETPLYAALNIHTGIANKVWSGIKEHHVTADIIYALWEYYKVTKDTKFLRQQGYEMLIETAIFWYSRSVFSAERDRFELLDLIGPDEYTEHIDNNAYTNYMAWHNVRLAKQETEKLRQEDKEYFAQLEEQYSLLEWQRKWEVFLDKLYLPRENEEGIIPQDDTFLEKKQLPNIAKYKNSDIKQLVLLDYSREEIINMQVQKQADIVMLLNMMPSLFAPEIVLKNVLFYEKRTIHDSSLSYPAHAIACAKAGYTDMAYQFFTKAMEIDLDTNHKDSTDGIHSGSLGGIWNCIMQGFAGVRHEKDGIIISPNLPKQWEFIEFCHTMGGAYYRIKVSRDGVTAEQEGTGIVKHLKMEDGGYYAHDLAECC